MRRKSFSRFIFLFLGLITSCSGLKKNSLSVPLQNAFEKNREVFMKQLAYLKLSFIAPESKAGCLDENGQDEFENLLQLIKKSAPKKPETFLKLADCFVLNEDFAQAFFYYDMALSYANNQPQIQSVIHTNMANIYLFINNINLAHPLLIKAIQLNPHNYLARYQLALIYLKWSEYSNSLKQLEFLVKKSPRDPLILYAMGVNFTLANNRNALQHQVLAKINDKTDEYILLSLKSKGENKLKISHYEVINKLHFDDVFLEELRRIMMLTNEQFNDGKKI